MSGDIPCKDCGTNNNIVWWTDNVFWNHVMGDNKVHDETMAIVCPQCFVKRSEKKYKVTGWRIIPEFHWEEAT